VVDGRVSDPGVFTLDLLSAFCHGGREGRCGEMSGVTDNLIVGALWDDSVMDGAGGAAWEDVGGWGEEVAELLRDWSCFSGNREKVVRVKGFNKIDTVFAHGICTQPVQGVVRVEVRVISSTFDVVVVVRHVVFQFVQSGEEAGAFGEGFRG
jgi:hypothetical protein